jgi:phosphoglycolate phosphatase-like HAD superfamily hydrolase
MLHDMPRSRSTALVADPDDAIGAVAGRRAGGVPAKTSRRWRAPRVKIVKQSALGALLRPVGISIALILSAYALVSLGTTFYRSYYRHLDSTAPVHADKSVFDIFFGDKSLPPDAVDLVIRDVDGSLRKVVASKSEAAKFVNDTILMLEDERARIKQMAHEDLDRSFALAFQDREQAISAYADWYFEWKRSYVVLKETVVSAITRFFEAGKYESVHEAIEADIKDYFLTNYKDQVLKPELRDLTLTKGVEQSVRHAHDSYRRVIANGDMRLQLFLAEHTSHLEDIPAATPMSNVKLDWDAQKWKAPTYLMEDRAFDGVVGVGTAAAGGTVGALALGPAINAVLARSFGQLSTRVATSLGTRIAFAQQGAIAGTVAQPVGGQVVGAAIGIMIGAAVDYLANATNEAFNRESFVAANEEALDATIATWKAGLAANIDTAIDKWFDDARAAVVLASQ